MKNLFFIISLVLILSAPLITFAHGNNYLEFNPDQALYLKDADIATPSQVFFAQSDFMSGFDIWVSNPGSSGTATFDLLNDNNIVITSKTVVIPSIAVTDTGTKIHVDWSTQLPVLASDKYSIRITSSMPELRLYYSNRVQLLSHNAPFTSPYLVGIAKLGSEEQDFSFKFTLYESNESSAPIISNVAWVVIDQDNMRLDFNTNEAVDYKLDYGPNGQGYTQSIPFLGDYKFCTQGISLCSINVPVSPDTTYQYQLIAKDSWGNQSQLTGTFSSGQAQAPSITPTPSNQPAVISNLRAADSTNNSVGIAWTTDKIANSYLLISFSSDLITVTSEFDPTFELEHYLATDPILGAGVTYLATVRSNDLDGNETIATMSFKTLANPTPVPSPSSSPTPSPQPSQTPPGATPTPQSSPQASSTPLPSNIFVSEDGNVQWNPPSSGEPKDGYRIDVFDKDGKLVKTYFAPADSHNVQVEELSEGDKIIVYQNEGGVFKKIDKPAELKAKEPSFIVRLLALWPYISIAIGLIAVFFWLRRRSGKNKTGTTAGTVS